MSSRRSAGGKAAATSFEPDEAVLCLSRGAYYEAKVVRIQQRDDDAPLYRVHYQGWSSSWDESVEEDKILKKTDDNLRKMQEYNEKQKQALLQAKKKAAAPAATPATKDKPATDDAQDAAERAAKRAKPGKAEISLVLPEALEVQLVDDWEAITRDQRLVEVPKKPSVADILADFTASEIADSDEGREIIQGVQLYFDRALGKMLLYRFERQQYATLLRRVGSDARMSDSYGCEHLLRLIVKLPQLLETVHMSRETILAINATLGKLIKYLNQHLDKLVMSEYDNAPPEYISLSKSG